MRKKNKCFFFFRKLSELFFDILSNYAIFVKLRPFIETDFLFKRDILYELYLLSKPFIEKVVN